MTATRRDFLRTAGLAAAAAAVAPSLVRGADAAEARAPGSSAPPRGRIVDWHTHWVGPRVAALLQARTTGPRLVLGAKGEHFLVPGGADQPRPDAKPQDAVWYDIGRRLAHLDEVGVARQVVGFTGSSYDGVLPPSAAQPFWRAQNDDLAELVRTHPKRFLGLATLPTSDVAAAAAELERAHTELGLIGGTLPLDAFIHLESARALAPIFAAAQRHKSHLYIHRGEAAPTIPKRTPEVGETNAYFGYPATRGPNGALAHLPGDHAWARATLITSTHLAAGAITLALTDLMDPYPDVSVQLTMIGGSIAQVAEAVDQRVSRDGGASIQPRLRRIYLDTGATGRGPRGIALAAQVFGADRILFGSDYGPWPTIEPFIQGVAQADLTAHERDLIYFENGAALLAAKNLT